MSDPKTKGWVTIHEEECKGCTMCLVVCPARCLEVSEHLNMRALEAGMRYGA